MAASKPGESHRLYERLWNDRDVEGLVELYEGDAVVVQAGGQHLRGFEQIRAALPALTEVETRLELIDLVEVGDLALERCRWTIEVAGADGKAVAATGESIAVLRRQPDGCWRIVIDDPGLG